MLDIESAVVCGLSWGGAIAQAFGVRAPERLKGLVLAGSAVSMSVTLGEKLLRYVLFPRWAMLAAIRLLTPERFVRLSLWLADITLGRHWLGRKSETLEYLRQCMLHIPREEYLKIWGAIYAFNLLPLERISCPTLAVNGERDARMTFRHTAELLRRVPHAEARTVPGGYHAMPLEQPQAFNGLLEEFLHRSA
jgi:pimeloyl-ACP methyl ester carboxylesterase